MLRGGLPDGAAGELYGACKVPGASIRSDVMRITRRSNNGSWRATRTGVRVSALPVPAVTGQQAKLPVIFGSSIAPHVAWFNFHRSVTVSTLEIVDLEVHFDAVKVAKDAEKVPSAGMLDFSSTKINYHPHSGWFDEVPLEGRSLHRAVRGLSKPP